MAQVTIFGIVDVGYGSHETKSRDGTAKLKTSGVMDGSLAGSRIGFRGEEDLGGGMKANIWLEYGMSPTSAQGLAQRTASGAHQIGSAGQINSVQVTPASGAGSFNGQSASSLARQTYVGLTGGFGGVRLGYQYTASYALASLSGFAYAEYQGANFQNAVHVGGTRANLIEYTAPKFGAITLRAQIGQGTGRATAESTSSSALAARDNTDLMTLRLDYAAGPVAVGFAYTDVSDQDKGTGVTNENKRDGTQSTIAASYDLGVAKIVGTYNTAEVKGSTTSTATTETEGAQITVAVPFGAALVWVSTGQSEAKPKTGAATSDKSGNAIGVRYALSKRTTAYAIYGSEKDKKLTGNTMGYEDTKTVVGLNHSF
jgi:predicted porin